MSSVYFNTADSHSLEADGFKLTKGGAHNSRTMMLAELEMVLRAVDENATAPDYAEAIVTQNVLAKDTVSTRKKTLEHLKELYYPPVHPKALAILQDYLDASGHGSDAKGALFRPIRRPDGKIEKALTSDSVYRNVVIALREGNRHQHRGLRAALAQSNSSNERA